MRNNHENPSGNPLSIQQTAQNAVQTTQEVLQTAEQIRQAATHPERAAQQVTEQAQRIAQSLTSQLPETAVTRSLQTAMRETSQLIEQTFHQEVSPESPLPEVHYRFHSDGHAETSWRVKKVRIEEGISELYEAMVEVVSEDLHIDPLTMNGHDCTLVLQREGTERRLCGIVRRVERLGRAAGNVLCRVYIAPVIYALTQSEDCRIFQNKNVQSIVADVVEDLLAAYRRKVRFEIRRSLPAREYCVQYQETTYAFISRLLAEEGLAFTFDHSGDTETLVVSDHNDVFQPVYDHNSVFTVRGPEMETGSR